MWELPVGGGEIAFNVGSSVRKIVYEYFCIKEILKAFFLNLFSMGLHFEVWAFFAFPVALTCHFQACGPVLTPPHSETGSCPQTTILL